MKSYSRSHLSNGSLRQSIVDRVLRQCEQTADLLADIAEFDERKLFREEGYDSLFAWCVGVLPLSRDSALKRIDAARAARELPAIFYLVATGQLSLTAVVVLAPHLRAVSAEVSKSLLEAAAGKTVEAIRLLLAGRFPRPDMPTQLVALPGVATGGRLELIENPQREVASNPLPIERTKLVPLAPKRFALQVTIPDETRELLEHVQSLIGHKGRDVAEVLHRALAELARKLEKRKFAATDRPRNGQHARSSNPHYIPAHVKRAVWKRDGGRCTYVSPDGHRCECRSNLQYDHIVPVKHEGEATVDNVRLLCHAHNQLMAEQVLGAQFMQDRRAAEQERRAAERKRREAERLSRQAQADAEREKRRQQQEADRQARLERQARLDAERDARRAAADRERGERREKRAEAENEKERRKAELELEQDADRSVIPWLKALGFTLDGARRAAKAIEHLADAPMQERIKAACRVSCGLPAQRSRPMAT